MRKKILFNVLLNIALILCIIGLGWSYKNNSPLIVAFFGAASAAIVYVKVQLVKSLRKDFKQ